MPRDTITITPHDVPADEKLTLTENWRKLIRSFNTAKETLQESSAQTGTDVTGFLKILDDCISELEQLLANKEHTLEKFKEYTTLRNEIYNITSQTIGMPSARELFKSVVKKIESKFSDLPQRLRFPLRRVFVGK